MDERGVIAPHRIEKLALIIFLSCLVILFLSGFDTIKAKVRDIKRRADMRILTKALDLYHDKYGKYPDSVNDWQDWDLSMSLYGASGGFLDALAEENLIDRPVKDPVNSPGYHYRYQKYSAGDYDCANSFYILQVVNFELPTSDNGRGQCPEFNWLELAPNGWTAQGFD